MDGILGDYLRSVLAFVGALAATAAIALTLVAFFKPEVVVELLSG